MKYSVPLPRETRTEDGVGIDKVYIDGPLLYLLSVRLGPRISLLQCLQYEWARKFPEYKRCSVINSFSSISLQATDMIRLCILYLWGRTSINIYRPLNDYSPESRDPGERHCSAITNQNPVIFTKNCISTPIIRSSCSGPSSSILYLWSRSRLLQPQIKYTQMNHVSCFEID